MRNPFSLVAVAVLTLGSLSFSTMSYAHDHVVHVEATDSCHLCGMVLVRHPGPKGAADLTTEQQLKFCSTRDLFEFVLQPDKARHVEHAFVHDMSNNDWDQPTDQFVDAKQAWYVYGSSGLRAAMGPALASFATEQAAQKFANQYGGNLYRYDEISLKMLNSHRKAGMKHNGHGHHKMGEGKEHPAHHSQAAAHDHGSQQQAH